MLGQRLVGPTSWDVVNRISSSQLRSPLECVLYIFYSVLDCPLPYSAVRRTTDIRNAQKISSAIGSDGCSIANEISAVEHEGELVSLFTPGFALRC